MKKLANYPIKIYREKSKHSTIANDIVFGKL